MLNAYTETGNLDEEMLEAFELNYKGRFEEMKPIDSATFYYCFTKAGFKGSGMFYKYLQKAVTKTIRAFEGPQLRLMFYRFDDIEATRLNRGVRGRLIEHCKYLMQAKKLKGFDAKFIYDNTLQLPFEERKTNAYDPVIDMRDSKDELEQFDEELNDDAETFEASDTAIV